MIVEHLHHGLLVEDVVGSRLLDLQMCPVEELGAAQPVAKRNRESELGAVQNMVRHNAFQGLTQRVLGRVLRDLLIERYP